MKYKLAIAIIMSIILIGGGIAEVIYLQKTFDTFMEKLEKIISKGEPYELAEIEEVGEWWASRHTMLELVIPHFQLNDITVTYGELVGAVKNEDYDSATALLCRIQENAKRLSDIFEFRVENII